MNTNNTTIRILCYGDSNTWGWVPSSMGMERFSVLQRWPGIVQKMLGSDYEVIEEGLGARTTMFDDPRPEYSGRNGLATLPIILESHLPLDLVIFMLGATDTKEMMHIAAQQSIEGMRRLIETTKKYKVLKGAHVPQILIIVPTIVKEDAAFASKLFKGGTQKGKALIKGYKKLAESEGVFYLNPTDEIIVDEEEGVHFDAENHKKLAALVYNKVCEIFA